MSWFKKGTIFGLFALSVIVVIFYFLGFFSYKAVNPWLLIPKNAAVIVDIENPKELFESVSNNNEFWKSLLSVQEIKDLNTILGNLDSLNTNNYPLLNELFSSPFLLSLHPRPDSLKLSYLISIPNKHLRKKDDLNIWAGLILNNSFEIEKINEEENGIFIRRAGTENGVFIIIHKNVLLISSDRKILENIVLEEYKNTFHFTNSIQFQDIKQTAGKNVQAHIYINYQFLKPILTSVLNNNSKESLGWIENFAGWSVLDILIKNDVLLFSGYTDVNNSKQFLAKYSSDIPVSNEVYKMLPFNTTFLLNYATVDFKNKLDPETISELNTKTGVIIENLFSTLGDEVCLASTATKNNLIEENSWAIIKLKDKKAGANYFDQMAKNSQSNDSEQFKEYVYKTIKFENILSQLFGFPFQTIEKNWYTIIDDYIVFANSPAALTSYISTIEMGKTLENNENFIEFSNNLSNSSNITLMIKPKEIEVLSKTYLNNSVIKNDGFLLTFLNSINLLSFQFNSYDQYFYTSFSANHSKNFKEEKPYMWKFQLESEIASKPFLVRNEANNSEDIIVIDELFTMFCINSEGNLKWQKRLDSPVLGTIHEVVANKNEGKQLLFNTKEIIYLLDLNGESAPGFPVKISPSATNGLTLYRNAKEYRILIAQSDKVVHNYTIEGKPVTGWKLPKTDDFVTEQITYLEPKNKLVLVVTDNDETVHIADKFGSMTRMRTSIEKAIFSNYYENETNSKGEILTTNKQGKLTYISAKGKIQYTDFGKLSPEHYFLYEDFNGDKVMDFIYVDGKKLIVFDRFKKTLFSYTFNSEIKTGPVFQRINSKQIMLAIAPENENSIYLFDNTGEVAIYSLPNYDYFTLYLSGKSELNLVVGSEKNIYFYRLR